MPLGILGLCMVNSTSQRGVYMLYTCICTALHLCFCVCDWKKELHLSVTLLFVILNLSAVFSLQTNEVTNRIQCHRSRWWTRRRAAALALWKHPTLPTSSSRMWGRVSCPRLPWSVATPWPPTLLPTPKTGWASLRWITDTTATVTQTMLRIHLRASSIRTKPLPIWIY